MTTRTNAEQLVQTLLAAWNSHDVAAVGASYASNAEVADPAYPEPLVGRAAIEKDAADFFAGFPDLRFSITKVVSDGNTIAIEGSASGTHQGPLQLPTGVVPATNRRIDFRMGVFFSVNDAGETTDERRYYDIAGQLAQLGLMQ